MAGHHTFTSTKFFGAEMEGQGEFDFEVTVPNTGSFEWTLRTEHDENAYKNWDYLWADIEMEVEEQVGGRWEDELDSGYGGHNPGFGDGFEVTLELTEEAAKEHGVEEEYAWVDWSASSSSPWYSAEDEYGAETSEVQYPHQVFNSTSKAHAEKVASLVPDSIVKGDSGHPLNWFVLSKTSYSEARPYYTPWLRENDYFRSNQFLSEVKYEAESFSAESSRCAECASPIDEEEIIGDGTSRGECCACWACYEELGVCNDKRDCARWEDEWDAESFDAERWEPKPPCEECGAVEGGRIDGCDDCNFTYWFNGKVYHPDSMIHIGAESFSAQEGDKCPYCYCEHENVSLDSEPPYFDGEQAWVEIQCDDCNMKATAPTHDFEFDKQGILEEVGLPLAVNMENPNYGTLRCSRCHERMVRAAESFSATARINPMPTIDEEVACMDCLWGGKDAELLSLTDEYGVFKGCPKCHSDNLIDLTREHKYAEDREESERMTRPEAEALADKVEKLVAPYVDRVEVCGSYRRGSPRPGDLDVIIIPKKGITLPDMVKAIKPSAVNWIGEKKTQVVIDGRKVDFRVSSPKGWGAALLYFTGPAGYNIGMRVRAKKMGMKLNEYGIFDRNTNAYLGGATEDEIYTVLGKTPKLPAMRAESVGNSCSHCGAKGELVTIPTRMGHRRTFCGPVCFYGWEGQQRLAAEEVFEAPRAAFTNANQAAWEKSYNIRAKKPLTKFLKQRMNGKKPSDDERAHSYYSNRTADAQGVTPDEAKLIQGYATVMKMAASRFDNTNDFRDDAAYKTAKNGVLAYNISWDPRYNSKPYLEQAVKDLHTLESMTKKEKTAFMAADAVNFKEKRLPEMREFLRYYDITMIGPYAGVKMVATDRAPYSISGGYGDVHYSHRNPYSFGRTKLVRDIYKYDSTKETLTIGANDSEAAVFTRMTKMRPYTERPKTTNSKDAFVEYETHGGSGWSYRGQGAQSFSLAPMILRDPTTNTIRNPNPGYYASQPQLGWRWDVEGWESRKSAPYRYATMVAIPNGEGLQMTYGSRIMHRNQIVDTINACTPLLKTALKDMTDAQAKKEIKEEKEQALRSKNQALTELEGVSESMVELLKIQVNKARNAGVPEDEIYETLEMTQYDLEQLVDDWEPSDYMAEGSNSED